MKCWRPRTVVYFPKYVCINNFRLAVVYWVLMLITMGIALYQFLFQQRYNRKYPVSGEVSLTTWKLKRSQEQLRKDVEADLSERFCAVPGLSDYQHGRASFTNIECARLCAGGETVPCVTPGETFFLEEGSTVFFPSFFREKDSNEWGFPPTRNYFVPGVSAARLAFTHKYAVQRLSDNLHENVPLEEGDTGISSDETVQDPSFKLLTVLLNREGEIQRRFEEGTVIDMSLDEMFEATNLIEYSDTVSRLSFDGKYTRVDEDIIDDIGDQGVTVRLTGVTLFVELTYTNEGMCRLDSSKDWVSVDGWTGKVCCMAIKGLRNWIEHREGGIMDLDGRAKSRFYQGVRVQFRSNGEFAFLHGSALFDGLTTLLIWSQIPLIIIYYFIITVLGRLSDVYSRVIHHSMSIREACTGLAARLIGYSSSFLDVLETGETCLSKSRLVDRFRLIFRDSEDLDDVEVMKLVEFIYKGMIGSRAEGSELEGKVTLQDFCAACSSQEPLSFHSLITIFNRDRRLGCLETLFLDDTMKAIQAGDFLVEQASARSTRVKNQLPDMKDYSQLDTVMDVHTKQMVRCAQVKEKVQNSLKLAEYTLSSREEKLLELRRQDLVAQGSPESRPPVKLGLGQTYHGDWVNSTRHGYGIEYWPNGSTFEGQWSAGRLHGHALYRQADGAKYAGQFVNGKPHGKGVHISENGAKYEGEFRDGVRHGRGNFFHIDGSSYTGEVRDNLMHGEGEYEWVDGKRYKGQWLNNLMHGDGVYTFVDGSEYAGQYRENEKTGHGTFRWPDGKRYEGQYENNRRSGRGMFMMPDGTRIEGTWRDGKQDGPGIVTKTNGSKHEARWDMGILVQ